MSRLDRLYRQPTAWEHLFILIGTLWQRILRRNLKVRYGRGN